jgi:hypothetical protein
LLFFLDGELSFQEARRIPLACLHWKDLDPESPQSDSSFTAPRLGHNILREMGKNAQKEGMLIIILFFYTILRYVL